ncbi:hypothetical protein [Kocuria sp.]|uniref:hypothetical protein n=1 Tax=Kocuria sp. TaxID=1871328 RepID=UPI0026E060B6|nr:hypothetical protein [Kocuria sp.]MDO5618583.1 hypothetical protein [Kocuria sp.]
MVPADQPNQQHSENNPLDSHPEPAETAHNSHRSETVTYRRAPKLPVFLILGGALGAVLGLFVGVFGAGNAMFTTGQVVGYMIAIFTLLGFSVGAVVALILDRMSLKRAQELDAQVQIHSTAHRATEPEQDRGGDPDPQAPTTAPDVRD